MYKEIESLMPYFHSLRALDSKYFSIDIKIPLNWVFDRFMVDTNDVSCKIQDKNSKTLLISLIGFAHKEGLTKIFKLAEEIIKFNIEEEEKNKLLALKIKELESMFSTKTLDELKEININEVILNGETLNEGPSLAGEGN
jgi:hypothetical protein